LSPSDDDFWRRMSSRPGDAILPGEVAEAITLYAEKVQPQRQIFGLPRASASTARSVAEGDRDNKKQNSLYVRVSEAGEVISLPKQATPEEMGAELDRT